MRRAHTNAESFSTDADGPCDHGPVGSKGELEQAGSARAVRPPNNGEIPLEGSQTAQNAHP